METSDLCGVSLIKGAMAERSQKRKAEMSLSDEERMAVVSHYLHNRGYASEKVYEDKALPLLRDFYAEDSFQGRADGILAERSVQASLFPQFFSVPFPETRCPEFTFIDLFTGIGGFRIALQNQGGRCVYSSEWDVQAQKTYLANFGEMPFGDITCASTKAFIPDRFDVLCAGFPCQPFSISGRQKGFEDTRGTLFFDICQILDEKRPPVVFLENVKHLMYHDGGKTLNTILEKLSGLGYKVSWRILNGADYGVPQNRERIIIIGSRDKLFDFGSLRAMPRRPLKDFLDKSGDFEYLDPSEYTLLEQMHQQPRSGLIFAGYRNKSIRKVGVRPGTEHLSRVHKQPNRIYSVEGIHPTLPSQESSGRFFILTEDHRVRKLTISECWRIMGFPDEYVKVSAVGQQYKQLGNSVCVKMIEAIGKEIKRQLLFSGEYGTKGNIKYPHLVAWNEIISKTVF